jgi:hypothetical protein
VWHNHEIKAIEHLQTKMESDVGFEDKRVDLSTGVAPTSSTAPIWPNAENSPMRFAISNGIIGASKNNANAAKGLLLDEISLWRKALTPSQLKELCYVHPSVADAGLAMAYTFDTPEDLEVLATTTSQRTVTEVITEKKFFGEHLIAHTPGAPHIGTGIIHSDTEPTIYRQPDVKATGYNPNEEHAFIRSSDGGYTVWALRCDLNTNESSAPGVLVSYSLNGKAKMQWIGVQATSEDYPTFSGTCTAGSLLPGPHPFDLMPEPWLKEIQWANPTDAETPAYRDRKQQVWARCAGDLSIKMYYRNDPSFDFITTKPPAALAAIEGVISVEEL